MARKFRPRIALVEDVVPGTAVRLARHTADPFQVVDQVVEITQESERKGWRKILFWNGDTPWLAPGAMIEVRDESQGSFGFESYPIYGPFPDPDPLGINGLPDRTPDEVAEMLWEFYTKSCVCSMDYETSCNCPAQQMAAARLQDLLGEDWHPKMVAWFRD